MPWRRFARRVCRFGVPWWGDGPLRAVVEARVRELDLEDAVTLTGALPPDEVAGYYRQADVVVLASFSEGVPVVLMEALAHGRPVVATRVGGIPELVEHGVTGLVVSPGDVKELAEALQEVFENPEFLRMAGIRGPEIVSEEFSIRTSAERLENLFECERRREDDV